MLRIIQIGSGGWGLSWLRFIHESSEWELAGLVSRGGSNLDQAREQFAIPPSKCFTDLEQALKIDANAVLIAVPQHLHAAVAQQALLAGKHVLCEKPLSDTFEGAKAVARFADTTDRKLCVVQNFSYRHGLWQLKAVIEQSLGRLDSLNV